MWEVSKPSPVKLIVGILAADEQCLTVARDSLAAAFGKLDFISDIFPFTQTGYYKDQTGENILRQFVSIEELIDPGDLAKIKHKTNGIEQKLARKISENLGVPRPVNLDPGLIEPSKLILATTKNYSHRIYIGDGMYAEVTLIFSKGNWQGLVHTYPDYSEATYHGFFTKVRTKLLEQRRKTE